MNYIRQIILLTLLIVISSHLIFSQNQIDTSDRVTQFMSLEIGPKINIKSQPDTLSGTGFGAMIHYGWQLSGFKEKKRKTYLSIPIGFSYIVDNKNREVSRQMNYGCAITHELTKDTNYIPFIGYGLLLNQYFFDGINGSIFGHQSRFEFGIDYHVTKKLDLFGKLDYNYIFFPGFNNIKSKMLHQFEIKFGAKFQF